MRRLTWLAAVPFLSGCFLFSTGKSSEVTEVDPRLKRTRLVVEEVPDHYAYGDVTRVQVGQWARYRVGAQTITLAVVKKDGEDVWVEVIEEGEPRQVSARRISPAGVVKEAYYCEVTGTSRTPAERQPLSQWVEARPSRTEAGRKAGEEAVTVGSRSMTARAERVQYEDADGRLVEEVTLWHKDVPPVYAGSEHGGLVRRQSGGRMLVDLVDFGLDAKPLLALSPNQ